MPMCPQVRGERTDCPAVAAPGLPGFELTRRDFLAGTLAASLLGAAATPSAAQEAPPPPAPTSSGRGSIAVIGAGAFGGWTALHLLRRGAQVTLLDAWGPGNSRASSGGETRVIRAIYGPDQVYTRWVARSFELWRDTAQRWGTHLYHRTGALWMFTADDRYAREALPLLKDVGLEAHELTPAEAGKRYPQVDFTGVRSVFHEPEAGYLLARQACEAVAEAFVREGGRLLGLSVQPGPIASGSMRQVALSDGSTLQADTFVFACGPWLGRLFPDVVGPRIQPTRQEVYFFGTPAGDARFLEEQMPVWVHMAERVYYGIPGCERRGFKIADDTRGEPFDPTAGERVPTPAGIEAARRFLGERFPALKGAPLVEARVCQYENTPDGNYLIDRHPAASNVWLVGGGSGHGFKLGPALGEHVAGLILDGGQPDPKFMLKRLESRDAPVKTQIENR
jgi:glycine/D-amino acid oxidase-like deaminating enzyme